MHIVFTRQNGGRIELPYGTNTCLRRIEEAIVEQGKRKRAQQLREGGGSCHVGVSTIVLTQGPTKQHLKHIVRMKYIYEVCQ